MLGVAISVLTSDNGILDRAKTTVDKYSDEEINEQIKLIVNEAKMRQILNGESAEDSLRNTLISYDSNAVLTKLDDIYEVIFIGKSFLLGSNLEYIPIVEPENTGIWTYTNEGKITAYTGTDKDIVIPNYINGVRIKTIGNNLFKSKDIEKLIISEGIEEIGQGAFFHCSKLTGNLIIPNTVTFIGKEAFRQCSFNGTLIIGEKVETIDQQAFYRCENLTGDLIIPDSVISIGSGAFKGCTSLNGTLKLGNKLTTIGDNAFKDCRGLIGDLIIPDNVTTLGGWAFTDCSSLNGTLKLSNNITIIKERTFNGCIKLIGNIVIPNNITQIEERSFGNCKLINSIKFQNNDIIIYDEDATIYSTIKIIGYSESKAKDYATKYGRSFEPISDN